MECAVTSSPWANLPTGLLVSVLSLLSHKKARISSYGEVCRPWRGSLKEDAAWKHLCKDYWYVTEERLKEWPALSAKGVYAALEQWVPLEGFYTLAPAYPWGVLVLVRIVAGTLVANAIRFLPMVAGQGDFQDVEVHLFSISMEEEGSSIQSRVSAPWATRSLGDLSIAHLDSSAVECGKVTRFFPGRRMLRIAGSNNEVEPDSRTSETFEGLKENFGAPALIWGPMWHPTRLSADAEQLQRTSVKMFVEMLGAREQIEADPEVNMARIPSQDRFARAHCDLLLIRSPADFVPQDRSQPRLRPGLYVGDYAHDQYGQFRTEVLLLEYVELSSEELRAELRQPRRLFYRGVEDDPAPAEALEAVCDIGCPVTFVRGVKQCGDVHVPMGATSFVALCGPEEACAAQVSAWTPPAQVQNRQTGAVESVCTSWQGFGSVALPRFERPSWMGGCLVQLEREMSTGDDRFGFVWERDQDAIVLHWVSAQDACPFLQRSWLPTDLQ